MPRRFATLLCLLALATPALADQHGEGEKKPAAEKADKQDDDKNKDEEESSDEPELSVTTGSVTIDGKVVEYVATAGKLVQKDDALDKKAEVFFTAYTVGTKDEEGEPISDPSRPITFCFNGGPGSASLWLHLGMLGPKRVKLPDDASFPAPPYGVVENPYSLLDVTDLVMIDPVSTGFSRPAEGEEKSQFHGLEEDVESVGKFIHDYVTQYGRWNSPKFVLGESYGGVRGAMLADLLQSRYRMYLNGVVFISAVFDFSTLHFAPNNDLPYLLFVPGYAATAWRHGALHEELQATPLEEVIALAEEFAYGDYADALLQGASMPEAKRQAVTEEMSRLTGLSVEYLLERDMRVPMWHFSKELLRDRNLMVGRFDSRYTGPDKNRSGEAMAYDPSGTAIMGVFAAAMNGYLKEELEYEDERVYEVSGAVRPWSYKPYMNRYVTTAENLREAMTANPSLRVFAACGYYDLATPAFAMKHTRDHSLLRKDLRDRFTIDFYEAGHMMYIHEPSHVKLRDDLVEWYKQAAP